MVYNYAILNQNNIVENIIVADVAFMTEYLKGFDGYKSVAFTSAILDEYTPDIGEYHYQGKFYNGWQLLINEIMTEEEINALGIEIKPEPVSTKPEEIPVVEV